MIAYNTDKLRAFKLVLAAERWQKSEVITKEQFQKIETTHPNELYHPPIWLRGILFVATILGLAAILGLFVLSILNSSGGELAGRVIMTLVGIGATVGLEYFIKSNNHYKSGVTEALLFTSVSLLVPGILGFEASEYAYSFAAIIIGFILFFRYANLLGGLIVLGGLSFMLFLFIYNLGPSIHPFIPILFLVFFTGLYYMILSLKHKVQWYYQDCIVVLDSVLLILIYLSMNYFVVRELSSELMGLRLAPGEDIPLAFLFYAFTFLVPIGYLTYGIIKKKIIFIRIGIGLVFASVVTYKIYYSSGHPEITLTLAGLFLTGITGWVLNKLKKPINGFTREKLLVQDGFNAHTESILISSTMGGVAQNQAIEKTPEMGGGEFGGGGAGSEF